MFAFDFGSVGPQNRRFEWLGTNTDVYSGGSAYNDGLPTSSVTDRTRNLLTGDRVFMVEIAAVPEPSSLTLAAIALLALRRRPRHRREHRP